LDEPGLRTLLAIKSARIVIRRKLCWISPGKAPARKSNKAPLGDALGGGARGKRPAPDTTDRIEKARGGFPAWAFEFLR